jgi:DNA polymerase III subunit delta
MANLTFDDILKDIRNKVFYPVYFLMGEESFYIDVITDYLEEKVLTEEEKGFNLSFLYGKETDVPTILSVAKRFPMMASHHLVIIREAQNIKDIEALSSYIIKPLQSTILVVCYKYKSLDRRKKFVKEIEKNGVLFEGKKLYDNQVPAWINDYLRRKGYRIGPRAVQMLADHLGADLSKIVNEIGKIFISLPKGQEVTTRVIEENIGISKDFNNFELQEALGEKNILRAQRIVKYFGDNPKSHPLVVTLAVLYQYFARILIYHSLRDKSKNNVAAALSVNPFFVQDFQKAATNYPPGKAIQIISFLRETDVKSKGVDNNSTTDGELLRELTYKILHI